MALTPTEESQTRQLIAQEAAILSLADNEATIISKLGATKVNLSQLPAASSIADADILLIRQGTEDKSVDASLFKDYADVPSASETVAGKVELATAAETQTGTDNTRAVHPAGLASLTATESRAGLIEVATQTENDAGVLDTRAVTPLKLRNGFAISLATNGYMKLPSWLGGIIFQWGRVLSGTDTGSVTFPLAHTGGVFSVNITDFAISQATTSAQSVNESISLTGFTWYASNPGQGGRFNWFSIGY